MRLSFLFETYVFYGGASYALIDEAHECGAVHRQLVAQRSRRDGYYHHPVVYVGARSERGYMFADNRLPRINCLELIKTMQHVGLFDDLAQHITDELGFYTSHFLNS